MNRHDRTAASEPGNLFIDSLPDKTGSALRAMLSDLAMPLGMPISRSGEPIGRIVFPRRSIISAVTQMLDGTEVEVMIIGRDGFHGLQAVLGDGTSASEAIVQLPNAGFSAPAEAFVALARSDEKLMTQVLRFAQASIETISQFSGCNRVHPVEQRCARWLSMVADRILSNELTITHEFIATMLGVRRPSVTLTLGEFEHAGMLETARGRIVLTDREKLKAIACECYEQSDKIVQRLLGYTTRY